MSGIVSVVGQKQFDSSQIQYFTLTEHSKLASFAKITQGNVKVALFATIFLDRKFRLRKKMDVFVKRATIG